MAVWCTIPWCFCFFKVTCIKWREIQIARGTVSPRQRPWFRNTEIFLRKMEKYKNTFKNRWCPPRMYFGRYIHHIWSFSTDAYFISGEVKNILHDSQKRCLFESKIPRNLELLTNLNMDLLSELKQRPPNGLHFSF